MKIPSDILEVMQKMEASGAEVFVVGGAVRDDLLNKEPQDYDLCTNVTPEVTQEIFKDSPCILNGLKHGTVMVIVHHQPVEITTYRKETDYLDHRHPEKVSFVKTLKEDVQRRDFTINGLAYHPEKGIQDFVGGVKDLENGVIRCIGEASIRFEEDALRILRALRFSSTLGFTIEEKTKEAIFEKKELLKRIAMERLNEEFSKLLMGQKAEKILREYAEVIQQFCPQFSACSFEFTAEDDLLQRLAVLFPKADSVKEILRQLKYPKDTVKKVSTVVLQKERVLEDRTQIRIAISETDEDTVLRILRIQKNEEGLRICKRIIEEKDCTSLKMLAVKGNDFKDYNGIALKKVLNECLLAVMEDKVLNRKEDLLRYIEERKRV